MKKSNTLLALLLSILLLFTGCSTDETISNNDFLSPTESVELQTEKTTETATSQEEKNEIPNETVQPVAEPEQNETFDLNSIPQYSGKPYVTINNNIPYFTKNEYTTKSFESYSSLDNLGRCGVAFACVGQDIMPTEERGSIGSVKPTGWHTIRYENIDGKYLYNRCHLLGYQLTGENANIRNLITGTRYLNIEGMLPFENMVADYVQETGNHALMRVTPIFDGNNLLASGVLMEALSIEDNGAGISFNVYCYNVQPGIVINYSDGSNYAADGSAPYGSSAAASNNKATSQGTNSESASYIANKNTKKFHIPSCSSVSQMKEKNKKYLNCSRDEAIAQGYSPCGNCNP